MNGDGINIPAVDEIDSLILLSHFILEVHGQLAIDFSLILFLPI